MLTKAKETITFPHCHLVKDVQLEIYLLGRLIGVQPKTSHTWDGQKLAAAAK